MTTRGISASEVPRELVDAAKALAKGDVSQLPRKRNESDVARKRARTGTSFEQMMDHTHRILELRHAAKLWEHNPKFKRIKKKHEPGSEWIPLKGGGPIDRTGHVFVTVDPLDNHEEKWGWIPYTNARARCIPVAFDLKVISESHATYHHTHEQKHQLFDLRDAADAGVFAFLLVHSSKAQRVFLLPIRNHFTELVGMRGVQLFESVRVPGAAVGGWRIDPLVPSITETPGIGWDWTPLLKYAAP